jgi:hypothetical protein
MKGKHKVGNTINSNSDMKYHINNVIPVWYANFHLSFLRDIIMVGGSLPPRHETTNCRPR